MTLRILDPACGSGSFLLGAYQYLLTWYRDRYVEEGPEKWAKGKEPRLYQASGGEWKLTTSERKRILLNHIYGVDIDAQAVEVTKLSLLLKVLEGETKESVSIQRRLFHERALPDLSRNIKCGNSLIGSDFYTGKQDGLFEDEAERDRINAFDWDVEFPEVFGKLGSRGEGQGPRVKGPGPRVKGQGLSEKQKATTLNPNPFTLDPDSVGFDVVIGNPPYVRIQTLKEWAPEEVEHYKEAYESASKGNYDIYVVFVERGLSLLNQRGRLGFILPHKFFNAKYGEALRGVLSRGHHLAEVIHFGDQQVFDGATTYTALLFLERQGTKECRVVKVNDLDEWRIMQSAPRAVGEDTYPREFENADHGASREGQDMYPGLRKRGAVVGFIPASAIMPSEWNFSVGAGAALFEKLSQMPVKLEDVTARIFQGLKTSADKIYILEEMARKKNLVRVFSREKEAEFWLEADLLHPLIKGGDSKGYRLTLTNRLILFPYEVDKGGSTALVSEIAFKRDYPYTWAYLTENKGYLENREDGKMKHGQWYAFGRSQALDVISHPKIFTPDIAPHASFSLDQSGEVFFTGGVAGGYGILVSPEWSQLFILGLLNSKVLDWVIRQTATQMRGGYYSFESRFIKSLPICQPDRSSAKGKTDHARLVSQVERMLDLNNRLPLANTDHDKTLLQRQIAATDKEIDRLVYDLYGLTDDEIAIVEGSP